MHLEPVLATVIAVVGLLLIAATASIGLRRVQFPFTVGLVLVGLILGTLRHRVEAAAECTGEPGDCAAGRTGTV